MPEEAVLGLARGEIVRGKGGVEIGHDSGLLLMRSPRRSPEASLLLLPTNIGRDRRGRSLNAACGPCARGKARVTLCSRLDVCVRANRFAAILCPRARRCIRNGH